MLTYRLAFTDRNGNRVIAWDPQTDHLVPILEEGLSSPYGLALTRAGLVVADKGHHRLLRIDDRGRAHPIVTCDASGKRASIPFPAYRETPASPTGLWAERDGSLLVTYADDYTLQRVHADGRMEWVLGISGFQGAAFNGCREYDAPAALGASVWMPTAITRASDGTIFFIERGYQTIRSYHPRTGLRSLFPARQPEVSAASASARSAADFHPLHPTALAEHRPGGLAFTDGRMRHLWDLDIATGTLRLLWTGGERSSPSALTVGPDGILWILDTGAAAIIGITAAGDEIRRKPLPEIFMPRTRTWPHPIDGGAGILCLPSDAE